MGTYRARGVIQAEQYSGDTMPLEYLLSPGETLEEADQGLVLHSPGRDARFILLGWWLSSDGRSTTIHAAPAFARDWEPAGQQ